MSSHLGFALSTTHVTTGSVLGTGLGRPGATVRWRVAGRMVIAWLITIPLSALVGAAMWWIAHLLGGGVAGAIVITAILIAASLAIYVRSRRTPVHAGNVNDEWDAKTPADERPTVDA